MADHSNKHIREAIQYALEHGWTLKKTGPRAHTWGMLYCRRPIEMDAGERCTRLHAFLNRMRRTFAELSIIARTTR